MKRKGLLNQRLSLESLRALMGEIAQLHVGTTLHVTDGSSERIFYFVKGGVRLLSRGPHQGVGFEGYVSRFDKVDKEDLAQAIEESQRNRTELRNVLVEKGILSRDEVNAIVSHLIRDELFELVFWRNAFFALHTQPPPEEIYETDHGGIGGSIRNADLANDVIRWVDDWSLLRQVLHSDETRVETTTLGREEGTSLAPSIHALLKACTEKPSIRDLWLASQRPLDQICRDLVELEERKLITLTTDRSWVRRSPEEEIADLEESLGHLVAKDLVRERLVLLYRRTKQFDKAIEQLKILARSALTAKDLAKANERYKLILNLDPKNLEVFETLIDLNAKSKLIKEVKNFALNHLQRLVDRSLYPQADHCARVLEALPGIGTEVVEFKASLLASRGRTREAAVECMRVAKLYDDRGDIALASHLYRKAAAYQSRGAPPGKAVAPQKQTAVASVSETVASEAENTAGQKPERNESRERFRLLAGTLVLAVVAACFHWRNEIGIGWASNAGGRAAVTAPRSPLGASGSVSGRGGDSTRPAGPRTPPEPLTRILNRDQMVTYADSSKLTIRRSDGRIVRELAGREGTRWAIGHRGRFICRWKAGERPVVFTLPGEPVLTLDWAIPVVTDALAVGEARILIRAGELTVVYGFDGTPIYEAELPRWEEGALAGGHVILTRSRSTPRMLWLVEAESLELLWSCRNEPQGLVVW